MDTHWSLVYGCLLFGDLHIKNGLQPQNRDRVIRQEQYHKQISFLPHSRRRGGCRWWKAHLGACSYFIIQFLSTYLLIVMDKSSKDSNHCFRYSSMLLYCNECFLVLHTSSIRDREPERMKERRTSIESMGTGQTLTHERKELTFTVRRWEQSQMCSHSWRIHLHPSKSCHLLAIESGIQGSTNTIENLHFRRKNVEDCVEGLLHLGDSNIRGHKQLSLWVVELESCVNSAHLRWKQSISRENRCTFRVECRKTLGTKE